MAFNVSLSKQTPNQASQLVLANVEALADDEVKNDTLPYKKGESEDGKNGGKNTFWDWWTQGEFKDEIKNYEACQMVEVVREASPQIEIGINLEVNVDGVPVGAHANASTGSHTYQITVISTGTRIWCDKGGNLNCSERDCKK